jgi:ribonuclease T2
MEDQPHAIGGDRPTDRRLSALLSSFLHAAPGHAAPGRSAPGRGALVLAALIAFGVACGPRATPTPQPTATGTHEPAQPPATSQPSQPPPTATGTTASFDYYVLALSWSPQFCATRTSRSDDPQCGDGKRFGFIAHGLWPQYQQGFPESCPTAQSFDPAVAPRVLPIMPSEKLMRHEWDRHGTCSGLSASDYFAQLERIYRSVHIPERFVAPSEQLTVSLEELKQAFIAANPGLGADMFAVLCGGGGFLREIRVCYSKQGQAIRCSGTVRDQCRDGQVAIRPSGASVGALAAEVAGRIVVTDPELPGAAAEGRVLGAVLDRAAEPQALGPDHLRVVAAGEAGAAVGRIVVPGLLADPVADDGLGGGLAAAGEDVLAVRGGGVVLEPAARGPRLRRRRDRVRPDERRHRRGQRRRDLGAGAVVRGGDAGERPGLAGRGGLDRAVAAALEAAATA